MITVDCAIIYAKDYLHQFLKRESSPLNIRAVARGSCKKQFAELIKLLHLILCSNRSLVSASSTDKPELFLSSTTNPKMCSDVKRQFDYIEFPFVSYFEQSL